MTDIPVSAEYASLTQETVGELTQKVSTEINPSAETPRSEEDHTNGLIADLAWILLLGAIVTLLFKKMKQKPHNQCNGSCQYKTDGKQ